MAKLSYIFYKDATLTVKLNSTSIQSETHPVFKNTKKMIEHAQKHV